MKFVLAMLALAMSAVLVGCDASESASSADEDPTAAIGGPTPKPSPAASASPSATATAYVPAANPTPIARPVECRDRGYGGRARDDNSAVDTYWLTDPPESQADAAYAVAQALCNAGGWYIPQGDVRVWKADYSLRQLIDWHEELREIFWTVPGFGSDSVNQGINRIEYSVKSERAKEEFERKITEMDVPLEAVLINVRDQMTVDDPPPMTSIEPGLELSIEFDQTAYPGEAITFTLTLENTSDGSVPVENYPTWGGSWWDLVIFTEDGNQIWRQNSSFLAEGLLRESEIPAGGSLKFEAEWDGLDDYEVSLEPGVYSVRAYFRVFAVDSPYGGDLSTHPVPLQVLAP